MTEHGEKVKRMVTWCDDVVEYADATDTYTCDVLDNLFSQKQFVKKVHAKALKTRVDKKRFKNNYSAGMIHKFRVKKIKYRAKKIKKIPEPCQGW
jgi:hypothetical protein